MKYQNHMKDSRELVTMASNTPQVSCMLVKMMLPLVLIIVSVTSIAFVSSLDTIF